MRNVSDKSCRGNENTYFLFNNFFVESRAVYEIMWKNVVKLGRSQMTIWRMRIACGITKATDTYSKYVILIAFSTATIVTTTRHNVTLYVHCLYCYTRDSVLCAVRADGLNL